MEINGEKYFQWHCNGCYTNGSRDKEHGCYLSVPHWGQYPSGCVNTGNGDQQNWQRCGVEVEFETNPTQLDRVEKKLNELIDIHNVIEQED